MKVLLFSLLLVALSSCDLPQKSAQFNEIRGTAGYQDATGGAVSTDDGIITDQGGSNQNGPGYEHCVSSFPYNGQAMGMFSLCKHSSDETKFQATFQMSSTNGTCFVPTHRLNNGTSFKLGRAECVYNQANTPYQMTLNKELMPPNFSTVRSEPINSVMVLRADAASAYMSCMNAKNAYLVSVRQIPGNYASPPCCYQPVTNQGNPYCLQANPSCEPAANNYANSVCSQFVQNYSGKYKEVIF